MRFRTYTRKRHCLWRRSFFRTHIELQAAKKPSKMDNFIAEADEEQKHAQEEEEVEKVPDASQCLSFRVGKDCLVVCRL